MIDYIGKILNKIPKNQRFIIVIVTIIATLILGIFGTNPRFIFGDYIKGIVNNFFYNGKKSSDHDNLKIASDTNTSSPTKNNNTNPPTKNSENSSSPYKKNNEDTSSSMNKESSSNPTNYQVSEPTSSDNRTYTPSSYYGIMDLNLKFEYNNLNYYIEKRSLMPHPIDDSKDYYKLYITIKNIDFEDKKIDILDYRIIDEEMLTPSLGTKPWGSSTINEGEQLNFIPIYSVPKSQKDFTIRIYSSWVNQEYKDFLLE